jgi:hypothetical protein
VAIQPRWEKPNAEPDANLRAIKGQFPHPAFPIQLCTCILAVFGLQLPPRLAIVPAAECVEKVAQVYVRRAVQTPERPHFWPATGRLSKTRFSTHFYVFFGDFGGFGSVVVSLEFRYNLTDRKQGKWSLPDEFILTVFSTRGMCQHSPAA